MAPQPAYQVEAVEVRWRLSLRLAFSFCFLYFILYCLTNQVIAGMFPIPGIDFPEAAQFGPLRAIVFRVASTVFRVPLPLVYSDSGSGDKTFDWVLDFSLAVIAAAGTLVWWVVDRRRANYIVLDKWFRVFLRFALGSEMLLYGMLKFVPLQMPFPSLTRLMEPFGNFSPMGVLWASIGASPRYEMFVGSAEMLGGILLFFPRTAFLGALVCLADSIEVFTLNMTYDVPVKLLSFHLIVISMVLLGPELKRLARFFFTDRTVEPSRQPKLFVGARAGRIAVTCQVVYGILLIAANGYGAWTSGTPFGAAAPKSPLYGIWNAENNGTGQNKWRRVIFDRPESVSFQGPDDSFVNYRVKIDVNSRSIALTKAKDKTWKATIQYVRQAQDQLMLDGEMDGQSLHMRLQLLDRNKLMLVNRGFHWVQEYPFNR